MKKKIITTLVIVFLLTGTITCMAAEKDVSFSFIDSNEGTFIDFVKKEKTSATAYIKITQMYDSSGNIATNYKKLKVVLGNLASDWTTATKGTKSSIAIKTSHQAKGTELYFCGMGNDPSLDCYIDATLYAD